MYKIGSYVKLAKLWEEKREEILPFEELYYLQKYKDIENITLCKVFVDITSKKEIYNRPQMLQLIHACQLQEINCIATQTKAYLAHNIEEFFFLLHFLFNMNHRIDIVTEDQDYNINTIENKDHQRESLIVAANKVITLKSSSYKDWISKVVKGINELE